MQRLDDFYSLWERYCIYVEDGRLTDKRAFELLKNRTTPELFNKLKQKVLELNLG